LCRRDGELKGRQLRRTAAMEEQGRAGKQQPRARGSGGRGGFHGRRKKGGPQQSGERDATRPQEEKPAGHVAQGSGGQQQQQRRKEPRRRTPKGNKQSKEEVAADAAAAEEAAQGALDAGAARRAIETALAFYAAKRAEEEEARRKAQVRLEEATAVVEDWRAASDAKKAQRVRNGSEEASSSRAAFERNKKKYKSDLKRTTAFVKKVKAGMSDDQRASLLNDVETLNLTLYVSELVAAVAETRKTKDKDVAVAATVCSVLHQRHADFAPALLKELVQVIAEEKKSDDDASEEASSKRRRAATRLLVELVVVGVVPEGDRASLVTRVTRKVATKDDPGTFALFAKAAAPDFLGVAPRRVRDAAREISSSASSADKKQQGESLLDEATKETVEGLVDSGFAALVAQLEREHTSLRDLERRFTKDAVNHGTLADHKEKALDDAKKAREKLLKDCATIADALDRDPPKLEDGDDDDDDDGDPKDAPGISVYVGDLVKKGAGAYDDETERALYEDYPNVLDLLPGGVLGLSEADVDARKAARDESKALWQGATLADIRGKRSNLSSSSSSEPTPPPKDDEGKVVVDDVVNNNDDDEKNDHHKEEEEASPRLNGDKADDEEDEDEALPLKEDDDEEEDEAETTLGGSRLTKLLREELPACFSRERADELALAFCDGLGTKAKARKRLAKYVVAVPRTALELLPHYARVTAVVSAAYGDVADLVVADLASEFRSLLRRKSQHTLESRLKNIRFLAELVKFRVAPPKVIFGCLQTCLDDFGHHNVDVACALLEHAGGFLLRSPPTKDRAAKVVEAMMRLKKAKPLNGRDAALVDSVYYRCFPVDAKRKAPKPRSELYLYVQYLLVHTLANNAKGPDAVDAVVKELRKLPWDDEHRVDGARNKQLPLHHGDDHHQQDDHQSLGETTSLGEHGTTGAFAKDDDDASAKKSSNGFVAEEGPAPFDSCLPLVVKLFLKLARIKADSAAVAADALSGLHKYRPRVSSRVVDAVLEEFDVFAIETAASARSTGANQRLVALARLFGELYNFSLVSTHQLLATLRRLLLKGHEITDEFRTLATTLASYDDAAVVSSSKDDHHLGEIAEGEEDEDDDDEEASDPDHRNNNNNNDNDDDPAEEEEDPYAMPSRRARYALLPKATHDPRVPCAADEAGDFVRVTLCCTILRLTAACVVAVPAARGPLLHVVDELQRYFFSKPAAPLGPKYALLDTLEELERGAKALAKKQKKGPKGPFFRVRTSWYEAHDAVQAHETASHAVVDLRALAKNKHATQAQEQQEQEDAGLDEDDDDDPDAEDEEDDDDEDDEDDEEEDDDEDEEEDDEEDEDDDDDEEEDDEDYAPRTEYKSPEELEFEAAFAATVESSMASARSAQDASARAADKMVMPTTIARRSVVPAPEEATAAAGSLKFQVLKRGAKGRVETRDLFVPSDSTLASQVQRNEAAQRKEHDLLKARTLMQARNQD